MMNSVRKHSRNNGAQANGLAARRLALPLPHHDAAHAREALLLREAPRAFALDSAAHAAAAPYAAIAAAAHAAPAFRLPPFFGAELQEGIWAPPVSVRETDDQLIVEAYIPATSRGDIQVEIRNGSTLVIKGERRQQKAETEHGGYLRKEFGFRHFFRSFALPLEVDPEGAVSHYRDGVLEIALKKKAEARQATYRVATAG